MASTGVQSDSDDGMDEFMDKFKTQRYKNAFTENNWEEVTPAFKHLKLNVIKALLL